MLWMFSLKFIFIFQPNQLVSFTKYLLLELRSVSVAMRSSPLKLSPVLVTVFVNQIEGKLVIASCSFLVAGCLRFLFRPKGSHLRWAHAMIAQVEVPLALNSWAVRTTRRVARAIVLKILSKILAVACTLCNQIIVIDALVMWNIVILLSLFHWLVK